MSKYEILISSQQNTAFLFKYNSFFPLYLSCKAHEKGLVDLLLLRLLILLICFRYILIEDISRIEISGIENRFMVDNGVNEIMIIKRSNTTGMCNASIYQPSNRTEIRNRMN